MPATPSEVSGWMPGTPRARRAGLRSRWKLAALSDTEDEDRRPARPSSVDSRRAVGFPRVNYPSADSMNSHAQPCSLWATRVTTAVTPPRLRSMRVLPPRVGESSLTSQEPLPRRSFKGTVSAAIQLAPFVTFEGLAPRGDDLS